MSKPRARDCCLALRTRWPTLWSWPVRARPRGMDSMYTVEAGRSAFVSAAAVIAATERVTVGTYIANAYAREPWLTAIAARDLDEMSGGRFTLGLGTGNRHFNEWYMGVDDFPAAGASCATTSKSSAAPWPAGPGNRCAMRASTTESAGGRAGSRRGRRFRCTCRHRDPRWCGSRARWPTESAWA